MAFFRTPKATLNLPKEDPSQEDQNEGFSDARDVEIGFRGFANGFRTVKIPRFWPEMPDVWFAQVESTLRSQGVQSDTEMYDAVLMALDANTVRQISDIVRRPPETDKFDALKAAIVKRLNDSRERQLQKFLNEIQLENRKPSQLLREMQDLVGEGVREDLLRTRFIQCMPTGIRSFLVGSSELSLDKLADTADRLMESCSGHSVMSVD